MDNEEKFDPIDKPLIDVVVERYARQLADDLHRNIEYRMARGIFEEKFCALCHVGEYTHGIDNPHPFFNNNLEYLEWESAKRTIL